MLPSRLIKSLWLWRRLRHRMSRRSVTANNSSIQEYTHMDDPHIPPTQGAKQISNSLSHCTVSLGEIHDSSLLYAPRTTPWSLKILLFVNSEKFIIFLVKGDLETPPSPSPSSPLSDPLPPSLNNWREPSTLALTSPNMIRVSTLVGFEVMKFSLFILSVFIYRSRWSMSCE